MMMFRAAVLLLSCAATAEAFSSALFQDSPALKTFAPSVHDGVDVELPDFDELFGRIQQVSPLARQVISGRQDGKTGFAHVDDSWPSNLNWKTVEENKRKVVKKIEKIDNFQGHHAPLLRFRASMEGPCHGELFANFIMDLEQRKRWDVQIENVYEIHPLRDLEAANVAMKFGEYGDCTRLGIGYCKTKANLGISGREQLTLCGIQTFECGSTIIWGTEMQEYHDNLFPAGERHTRAKSHIFSTTLTPTGDNTFDVEYVLQLEIGGNLPTWLTNPIMYDTIKKLFRTADACYRGKCDTLQTFLKEKERENAVVEKGVLMTP